MNKTAGLFGRMALLFAFVLLLPLLSHASTTTDQQALQRIGERAHARFVAQRGPTWERLSSLKSGPYGVLNNNPEVALLGIDETGHAIYYSTDNVDAARTTRANTLHPGGISGLDLVGASMFRMAVWDGGPVRSSHQEFGGRILLQDTGSPANHATHVAGTMIASGVNSDAKGMSPGSYLYSYDWDDDESEMAAVAIDLSVSNHSYSRITGWRYDDAWYWYGTPSISTEEDYGFGFYGSSTSNWDAIAYAAPNYMICKSAGNDRNDSGPGDTEVYYIDNGSGWEPQTGNPPPGDGGDEGWDTVAWYSTAKNIMTVGAVDDLPPGGYTGPGSVAMASFSCWGPVDDGRIKPDIVANGINLYSSYGTGDDDYYSASGTSMSSPNFAGTANLLFEHYFNLHGEWARASTMKAIIQHTADECGPAEGPDYMYGWGLVNAYKAAQLISSDAELLYPVQEFTLSNDDTTRLFFLSQGDEPIRVTIAWTDPAGTAPPASLDPSTPMLVNDLDLRLIETDSGTEHMPYVLDRDNPGNAPTHGDNIVDVSEQVYIAEPTAGEYTVQVSHKGTLVNDEQVYSIVITGMTWQNDPRIPPSNLTHNLTLSDGSVSLAWEQEGMGGEGFVDFTVLRDGEELGNTTELSYSDQLDEYGSYRYEVRSNWELGPSFPNPFTLVEWPAEVPPIHLQHTVLDTAAGDIELSWEQVRPRKQILDDDTAEDRIFFANSAPAGVMVVRSFTAETEVDRVLRLSAYTLEGEAGFGEVELVLFSVNEDGDAPGEELYRSDPFLPEAEEWNTILIESGIGIPAENGSTFFAGMVWQQPGTTELALDTNSPVAPSSFFSSNGSTWTSLADFVGGVFDGNPLLRLDFGKAEAVGTNGLQEFGVRLNGAAVGTTAETSMEITVDPTILNSLSVEAYYEQGLAISFPYEIGAFYSAVGENSAQPLAYTIGSAYPNPFNPSVAVAVILGGESAIHLTVYDVLGRQVESLVTGMKRAGNHTVNWNAEGAASGVYFLRVQAGPVTALRKVVLMR